MNRTVIITATVIAALALTGCQTTAEYNAQRTAALQQMLIDYRGQTVGQLLREQPGLSATDYEEVTSTRRIFTIEDQPSVSTVYVPPYTPGVGTFNNPAMAQAARNLATIHTVPGAARSVVRYCQLRVDADRTSDLDSPDSWRIRNVEYSGNNC